MNTIQELFQQAQLAEAAYANFLDPTKTRLQALQDEGMSTAQANAFLARWRVVDQYDPSALLGHFSAFLGVGSGFSATVFASLDNPGQFSLAIRGSQDAEQSIRVRLG